MRCGKMMSVCDTQPLAAWDFSSKVSCFLSRAMLCCIVADKQQDQIEGDDATSASKRDFGTLQERLGRYSS